MAEPGSSLDHPACETHSAERGLEVVQQQLAELSAGCSRMTYWTLDTFPADDVAGAKAKRDALEWLNEWDAGWLFIYGPVGSGKTGLAWSLIVEKIKRNRGWDTAGFVNVRQLLTEMRRSFGRDEPYDPTDRLVDTWTLVLDDLGAERVSDWTREVLATIVEGRHLNESPTIVTSNYAPSQLARRFGTDDPVIGRRIVSRITQDAMQIHLDRPDLRARRAA